MASNSKPTFINGRTGVTGIQPVFYASALETPVFLPDGKILADISTGVARFNADGSPDSQFGVLRPPSVGNGTIWTTGIQLRDDGSIVTGGTSVLYKDSWPHDYGFAAYRIKADGSIDPDFGNGKGWISVEVGDYDKAVATLFAGDGKIVVVGETQKVEIINGNAQNGADSHVAIARFTADGKVDTSFGKNGVAISLQDRIHVESAVVQNDGKILVAGYTNDETFLRAAVLRFNSDGTPDSGFGTNGMQRFNFAGQREGHASLQAMVLQPDGKILVAGLAPAGDYNVILNQFAIARLTANGQLDPTFGQGGTVLKYVAPDQGTWVPGGNKVGTNEASNLLLREDGSILVGGSTTRSGNINYDGQIGLLSLNPDGSLDTSFGNAGVSTIGAGDAWNLSVTNMKFDAAGKLMMMGQLVPAQGGTVNYVMARLLPDGSADGSFGVQAAASGTQNSIRWHESFPAQVLNASLTIQDVELDQASLTLARKGGANASDVFGTSGKLAFANGKLLLDSIEIGSVQNAAGTLKLLFNASANSAQVNEAMQSITYQNSSDIIAGSQAAIQWTFSDRSASAQFETQVTLEPAAAPSWIEQFIAGSDPAQIGSNRKLGVSFVTDPGAKPFSATETNQLNGVLAKLAGVINITPVANIAGSSSNLAIHSSPELAAGQVKYQSWSDDGGAIFARMPASGSTANTMLEVQEQLGKLLGLRDTGNGVDPFGTLETAALQYIYGVSTTARAGNDTYLLDATKGSFIWDGAGNDTISAANLSDGITIHLEPGNWDFIGAKADAITAAGQFTVNFGSVIENATGSGHNDRLVGSAAANVLQGGAGNDLLEGLAGNDKLDGGAGLDTGIFAGKRAQYTITAGAKGEYTVSSGTADSDALSGVERLKFDDAHVAIDINGSAGQVLRLYQAIFNRAPDLKGLGYWIDARDKGMDLGDIAVFFTQGAEFKTMYGATPSNTELLTKLYQYALHRAPDAAGLDFWKSLLDEKKISLDDLLTSFSESPENQAQVIGSIQGGIAYTPWLG